jgi:hypothetical protein
MAKEDLSKAHQANSRLSPSRRKEKELVRGRGINHLPTMSIVTSRLIFGKITDVGFCVGKEHL